MKPFRQPTPLLLTLLTLPLLAGCGGEYADEPQRRVVKGYVSYDGKTINEGTIRFVPTGETSGPTSGSLIKLGYYNIDLKGGVPLGTHRVEIEAFHTSGANQKADSVDPDPPREQYIPEKWNRNSELSVNVEAGDQPLESNFELLGE